MALDYMDPLISPPTTNWSLTHEEAEQQLETTSQVLDVLYHTREERLNIKVWELREFLHNTLGCIIPKSDILTVINTYNEEYNKMLHGLCSNYIPGAPLNPINHRWLQIARIGFSNLRASNLIPRESRPIIRDGLYSLKVPEVSAFVDFSINIESPSPLKVLILKVLSLGASQRYEILPQEGVWRASIDDLFWSGIDVIWTPTRNNPFHVSLCGADKVLAIFSNPEEARQMIKSSWKKFESGEKVKRQ